LICATASGAAAEGGKRVLIVHSFGSASSPFTTTSIALEMELTERAGEKLDLDEVYLDHARYPDTDMEQALVDYLQKRQAKWQPDLVVSIGSPAGIFVGKYQERLFRQAPILYTGTDRRWLPGNALQKNAAFVGASLDMPGFIEDMLQLAPDTTNIVCVIGASPAEQHWAAEFRREFAPFTNRVSFTWLDDVGFGRILEQVNRLPPHSFIFLIMLMQDAAGVSYNADEALRRISQGANAPVNSIFEHQLGHGIVGGRLYRAEFVGVEAARTAIRILHGEPASNFPPVVIAPTGAQYDWRQLRQWKISEDRLPPGSVVKYRVPTIWERHRAEIITGVSVLLAQAVLIAVLIVNLRRKRRAERSLRESEERMKLAAGAAGLGMWQWDFASNKVWLDGRSLEKLEAGENNESDYSRFLRMVHPEDRDSVEQALTRAFSGDGEYEQVHRRVLSDGQVRWIAARARVEFDAGHKPVRMRGVAMDITARKLAEEQARESERQFLLIANSAPVLIWTSGPDKLCTFFNQPWLEFRGRTMQQELGDGWAEGVHPEDANDCMKIYQESFDARQPFTMEYRLLRHDGQYRWVSDHGVPRYDVQKAFLGYIGSCVDVTERKEAEAEAQRSQQELAHVGRVSTLGALAGSLAHELNQPLTAIVSSAEAAQRLIKNGPANDEDVTDALKDIVEQGQRAGEIIAGMRAMLKKDPGRMAIQDMNLVVREVLEMVRSDLVSRRVTPVLRLDPLLPPVKGHGVQLRQVLLNLVMNACDAMSDPQTARRQLMIESRRVKANEVEVSVADSGPGFPQEILLHAFEPFRTTKTKGLGLGLTICRSIITTHGGHLEATNNAQKGATLRFTLPAENANGI
jgi:PAS domain S-box-containing protein